VTVCTTRALTSLEDIDRLEAWDALSARAPATLTGSRAWVRAAFEVLHPRAAPHVIVAERDGALVGIVSLAVERSASGPVARIAGDPLNDLADALVAAGQPDAPAAIARSLEDLTRRGVSIELNELDPAGVLVAALDVKRGRPFAFEDAGDAPTVALDAASELPAARRRDLDRLLRRLRERHEVRFEWTRGGGVAAALGDLLRLRAERFSAVGRTSELPPIEREPGFERFLTRMADELGATSRAAVATLLIDGAAAARDLYLLDGGVAMLFMRGLSPAWQRSSGGHLLLRWCIEELTREGFATLDLGRGDETYKYMFGATPRRLVRVTAPALAIPR
jgi:CelD/BcsL family acetyltransferase involved in cellulose biosynthesis